jgi:hypothetical protein
MFCEHVSLTQRILFCQTATIWMFGEEKQQKLNLELLQRRNRDSSVGIATKYGLDGPGSIPGSAFRPSLWPTQPPIQYAPGVERQGCGADHSPPSSAEVRNGGTIPSLPHMSSWRRV